MSDVPFILNFDAPAFYGHDTFPNRMYRRLHARHHVPLDLPTLGLVARLGTHGHHLANNDGSGLVNFRSDKNGFEVHLDVGLFKPNELSVKVVDDCIVIEGKHEEREDEHGFISRHFVRRYVPPKGSNVDDIESTLTSDGVLTVRLPKPSTDKPNERVVKIKQVGPSDLFLSNGGIKASCADRQKDNGKEEQVEGKNEI